MNASSGAVGKALEIVMCVLWGPGLYFIKRFPKSPSSAQNLAACPELLLINHFIGTTGQERTE